MSKNKKPQSRNSRSKRPENEQKLKPGIGNELVDAIMQGQTEIAQALIEDSLINRKDSKGNTPLLAAAFKDDETVTEALLKKGAKVISDNHESNALHYAVRSNGTVKVLEMIVNHLKKAGEIKGLINSKNNNGETPIMVAARKNNAAAFELFLNNGADLTIKSERDQFPAYAHIFRDSNSEIIKVLAKENFKFDFNDSKLDPYENPAFFHLIGSGKAEIFKSLANQKRINPLLTGENKNSVLFTSAFKGDVDLVKALCQMRCPVNAVNKLGQSALLGAFQCRDKNKIIPIVNILLESGANIAQVKSMSADSLGEVYVGSALKIVDLERKKLSELYNKSEDKAADLDDFYDRLNGEGQPARYMKAIFNSAFLTISAVKNADIETLKWLKSKDLLDKFSIFEGRDVFGHLRKMKDSHNPEVLNEISEILNSEEKEHKEGKKEQDLKENKEKKGQKKVVKENDVKENDRENNNTAKPRNSVKKPGADGVQGKGAKKVVTV